MAKNDEVDAADLAARLLETVRRRVELELAFGIEVCPRPEGAKTPAEQLEELRQQVEQCRQCELYRTRTNLVFGAGNPEADLMFVGEAPGYWEDRRGEPFVGRAGELLTRIIHAIEMRREDVYIANVLKCRPPGNRNPLAQEVAVCRPWLVKQIEIIRPKIICALGTFAAQALLNVAKPITALRGRYYDAFGAKLMPTFHPAYLLRNPQDKRKCWEDMKKIRDDLRALRAARAAQNTSDRS